MIAYLKGRWSPECGADGEEAVVDELDGGSVGNTPQVHPNEVVTDEAEDDKAASGEAATASGDGREEQAEATTQARPSSAEKKYDKLMGRFEKGGDMHKGGRPVTKTTQPTSYRLTVVTPDMDDLEKFGALLPSPIIDQKAQSVSASIRVQDIETIVAVVRAFPTARPVRRLVVEL